MRRSGVKDCARTLARRENISLIEAEKMVVSVIKCLEEELIKRDSVCFLNSFSIDKVLRKARVGQDINKGVSCVIPPHYDLKIKVGKELKQKLNEKE
jgi:nucleoid DNA-binding protein